MSARRLHRIGHNRLPQFPVCPLSDVRTYWGSLLLSRTGTPKEYLPCSPPVWSSFQTDGRSGPASFPLLSPSLVLLQSILTHRIGLSPVPDLPGRGDAPSGQTWRKASCSCSSASHRAFNASSYRTNRPRVFRFPWKQTDARHQPRLLSPFTPLHPLLLLRRSILFASLSMQVPSAKVSRFWIILCRHPQFSGCPLLR